MQSHIGRLRAVAALKGAPIALRPLSNQIVQVGGPEGECWGYYVSEALLEALAALPDVGDPEDPDPLAQEGVREAIEAAGQRACLRCGDENWEGLGVLCDRCGGVYEDGVRGRVCFPPSEAAVPSEAIAVRLAGVA